jgi:hypothetical protein
MFSYQLKENLKRKIDIDFTDPSCKEFLSGHFKPQYFRINGFFGQIFTCKKSAL